MDTWLVMLVLVTVGFPVLIAALTLRRAQDMEAVILRERTSGRTTYLRAGPAWYLQVPGLDDVQVLDLHPQRTLLDGMNLQTHEGLSAMVTVVVAWQQTRQSLARIDLKQVLPFLGGTAMTVETYAQLVVRTALSRYALDALMQIMRHPDGFQTLLKDDLQRRVDPLGVVVQSLELIVLPSPAVAQARLEAEARAQELRTVAEARAAEIQMLRQALNCGNANDHLVQLQAIDAMRDGNNRVVTTLGVGAQGGTGNPPIQFVVGP